ncbi:PfkB family carbohydrate kinase [Mycolicibacterium smegmatis]|uniref:2-Keto-3-deoxy-gluconate kinase n=2 Tax=Mycolicibacterium smegmatis (strain ATCC 700084 / mc(2)155) TaxID=246196 RepID=A0QWD9_MYCS2|nr:PfkB family carbohydrate kinase [Mycolicibacterium smegmatis]ABK74739.1 2-Keto-3-deoxy-gluconate kinase [Mycolicibacterium smegmatis MC2 155]AFP39299.1 Kinase, PfkB family [Mycolicibacterium smegmatis MC2 155]AIU08065.1 2-keto-3-deoxygluconate kinase [Mycolicibacterium smegmatis MC2 155]AIU14690.1 2-keto-3-deoxygluconate kinase [Mycolicibacterium smegmatis]AIU21313.1 2-keto-3-deoxygluconate kinase [Mycolicibacterium smegmatis]
MSTFDVVALGEPLIEVSTRGKITHGVDCGFAVSGDVVNTATAAVAAGARVAVVARVSDDELGTAVIDHLAGLGVHTGHIRRDRGFQGIYVQHSDPKGDRQFCYARSGSAGSRLAPEDLPDDVLESAGAVVVSGITASLSSTTRATVLAAAGRATRFVYDPNFRPRLTTAEDARALLLEIAPRCALITPSAPHECAALLGTSEAAEAAARLRTAGAAAVAVTCGAAGVHVDAETTYWQGAFAAPSVVDQTGAGDVFTGTVAARLALGDETSDAVRIGAAAASLAVGGVGGSGGIAPLEAVRAHAEVLA